MLLESVGISNVLYFLMKKFGASKMTDMQQSCDQLRRKLYELQLALTPLKEKTDLF